MINVQKKLTWIFLVILIGLCVCLLFRGSFIPEKNESYKNLENQLSVEEFCRLIQNQKPVTIKVFYIPFSSVATASLSETQLFSDLSLKINIEHIAPFCHKYFLNLPTEAVLFEKALAPYSDFRYCCLVKTESNKWIRFSISRLNREMLFINGQPYKVPFGVIDTFLKLLPVTDYEVAIKCLDKAESSVLHKNSSNSPR